jgi:hypothetical protein
VLLKTLLLDAGYADRKSFPQSALYKQKSKERIKKFNLRFRKEGQTEFDAKGNNKPKSAMLIYGYYLA